MLFEKLSARTMRVVLNKPKSLNALDLEMVYRMRAELARLESAGELPSVMFFEGVGGKVRRVPIATSVRTPRTPPVPASRALQAKT